MPRRCIGISSMLLVLQRPLGSLRPCEIRPLPERSFLIGGPELSVGNHRGIASRVKDIKS